MFNIKCFPSLTWKIIMLTIAFGLVVMINGTFVYSADPASASEDNPDTELLAKATAGQDIPESEIPEAVTEDETISREWRYHGNMPGNFSLRGPGSRFILATPSFFKDLNLDATPNNQTGIVGSTYEAFSVQSSEMAASEIENYDTGNNNAQQISYTAESSIATDVSSTQLAPITNTRLASSTLQSPITKAYSSGGEITGTTDNTYSSTSTSIATTTIQNTPDTASDKATESTTTDTIYTGSAEIQQPVTATESAGDNADPEITTTTSSNDNAAGEPGAEAIEIPEEAGKLPGSQVTDLPKTSSTPGKENKDKADEPTSKGSNKTTAREEEAKLASQAENLGMIGVKSELMQGRVQIAETGIIVVGAPPKSQGQTTMEGVGQQTVKPNKSAVK